MEDELRWRATWSRRITAAQDERLAAEGFDELPIVEEYRTLEKVYRTALYRDMSEADAAIADGGPGLLDKDE
jgi:hypothetical protein